MHTTCNVACTAATCNVACTAATCNAMHRCGIEQRSPARPCCLPFLRCAQKRMRPGHHGVDQATSAHGRRGFDSVPFCARVCSFVAFAVAGYSRVCLSSCAFSLLVPVPVLPLASCWFGCSVVCLFGRALVCARSSMPLVGLVGSGRVGSVCLFVSLVWWFVCLRSTVAFAAGRSRTGRSTTWESSSQPRGWCGVTAHTSEHRVAARTRAKSPAAARACTLAHTLECCRLLLWELVRDGADETASSRRRRSRAC